MKTIRWGLLSTAKINQALIPVIRQSARGKLAAVASRSRVHAESYARNWNIPLAFGSYQEMLESGEIDAVYISLPNHLHKEWTVKAIEAGIAVLCEKPFATSLKDADEMISASRETNVPLAEAFMYRHHPQTKFIGDWIRDGNLGDINVINGVFNIHLPNSQRMPGNLNVRMVPEFGGGCLWDIGVYPISYAQYLLGGPPQWVFGSQLLGPTGIDENFAAQMGYIDHKRSEVIVQFTCSFNSPFHTYLEILGTKGRLHIPRPFSNMEKETPIVFLDQHRRSKKLKIQKKPLYLGEVEDLNAAVLDGSPTYIDLGETRNHILTVLALRSSAQTKQLVMLKDLEIE